jgi:hypothetical protein
MFGHLYANRLVSRALLNPVRLDAYELPQRPAVFPFEICAATATADFRDLVLGMLGAAGEALVGEVRLFFGTAKAWESVSTEAEQLAQRGWSQGWDGLNALL